MHLLERGREKIKEGREDGIIQRWYKYLVFLALILLMLILKAYFVKEIREQSSRIYRLNYYYLSIVMLINIGIGLLLGLEHLIAEIKKDGTLKMNLSKIIFLGLPSLYLSCTNLLLVINNYFVQNILVYPIIRLMEYDSSFIVVFQFILGYVIATSFYKSHKDK